MHVAWWLGVGFENGETLVTIPRWDLGRQGRRPLRVPALTRGAPTRRASGRHAHRIATCHEKLPGPSRVVEEFAPLRAEISRQGEPVPVVHVCVTCRHDLPVGLDGQVVDGGIVSHSRDDPAVPSEAPIQASMGGVVPAQGEPRAAEAGDRLPEPGGNDPAVTRKGHGIQLGIEPVTERRDHPAVAAERGIQCPVGLVPGEREPEAPRAAGRAAHDDLAEGARNRVVTFPSPPKLGSSKPLGLYRARANRRPASPATTILPSGWMARSNPLARPKGMKGVVRMPSPLNVRSSLPLGL